MKSSPSADQPETDTPSSPEIHTGPVIIPATSTSPGIADMACVFDRAWYERQYPDVVMAGIDPVAHYREAGFREGRCPNRFFDPNAYRAANPDLQEYDGDLFLHFIFHGINEGRRLR